MPNQTLQNAKTDMLSVRVGNQSGRQIKELGNATEPQDAVPLSQVQNLISSSVNDAVGQSNNLLKSAIQSVINKANAGLQSVYELIVTKGINICGANAPKYPLEIRGPNGVGNGTTQIHIAQTDADGGAFITVLSAPAVPSNQLNFTLGCYYNGTSFIATNVICARFVINGANGNWQYFYATGQTVGSAVTFTLVFQVTAAGVVTFASPVPVAQGGTGATTASVALSNLGGATAGINVAGTVTLAKLTTTGANGSISWNSSGCVTSFVAPS